MSFFQGSFDFLTGQHSSHMGSYQYVDHVGKRNERSVSGAKLWEEIEAAELQSTDANLFSAEEKLLRAISSELHGLLPESIPILEMGPGTPRAFHKKTLLVMMALRSIDYICVDESSAFLRAIATNRALSGFSVRPILDDFFESDLCYFDNEDEKALICMFGSTIGNIVAPISEQRPEGALVNHLSVIAEKMHDGWLLISYDSNHDGENIKAYYNHHTLFHLNVLDRMAVELPISGDFDPCAFDYEPLWIPRSGQLAHMAVVQRDMSFALGRNHIELRQGQKLHLKNSFKFPITFFSRCCEKASLEVMKTWTDPSGTSVCLLKKRQPISFVQSNPRYLLVA